MAQNINTAALKVAAIMNISLFTKFASEFNTYDVRNSKGLPSDIARGKAIKTLTDLQIATGEKIILRPLYKSEDEEAVLDELYNELTLVRLAK